MVAKYEAEKLKYQKLMDKVPEEVKQIKMFLKHCHGFLLQVKEKAKAEKRQKKAIATGRNAAAELKVGVGFKSNKYMCWHQDMLQSLGKPKKPLSGYMLFTVDRRARSDQESKY